MDFENIRTIEEQIIKLAVKELLEADFLLSVTDTNDVIQVKTDQLYLITSALHNDVENMLHCFSNDVLIGYVYFVYGNNGFDVISKHSASIETYIKTTLELSEYLQERIVH